jgi:hypothetical protein
MTIVWSPWLAGRLLGADGPVSSALTRELRGWHPTHPGLIDDLDHGHYVRERSARPSHPRWARGSQSVDEYA